MSISFQHILSHFRAYGHWSFLTIGCVVGKKMFPWWQQNYLKKKKTEKLKTEQNKAKPNQTKNPHCWKHSTSGLWRFSMLHDCTSQVKRLANICAQYSENYTGNSYIRNPRDSLIHFSHIVPIIRYLLANIPLLSIFIFSSSKCNC